MFVLDANAAIAVVAENKCGELFKDSLNEEPRVISSELMLAESAHIIRKYLRGGFVNKDIAKKWLAEIRNLVDEFYPIEPDIDEVLHESLRLNHSPYDLFNFVLARRHNATIMSLDQTLIDLCFREGLSICTEIPWPPQASEVTGT